MKTARAKGDGRWQNATEMELTAAVAPRRIAERWRRNWGRRHGAFGKELGAKIVTRRAGTGRIRVDTDGLAGTQRKKRTRGGRHVHEAGSQATIFGRLSLMSQPRLDSLPGAKTPTKHTPGKSPAQLRLDDVSSG